jgi:hypothetical protein
MYNVSKVFWHLTFFFKQILMLKFISKQINTKFGLDYFAKQTIGIHVNVANLKHISLHENQCLLACPMIILSFQQ